MRYPPIEAIITYLTDGVDADVGLSFLSVGNHGLNEEVTENTNDVLNLDILASAGLNPLTSLSPGLVQGKQTALTTALDQLIGLRDELGAGGKQPWVVDLSLVKDILGGLILGEVKGGQTRRRVVCGGARERRGLDNGGTSEVVVEDGLAVGLED
jgi:hypothetical protein